MNRNKDFKTGWKISLSFNVSQRDETVLQLFRDTLCCGSFRKRKDGVTYFEVRRLGDLQETVIQFFEQFPLKSVSKRKQFEVFREIVRIVARKEHLLPDGLKKILALRQTIKVGRKRKYTIEQILSTSYNRNPQRLHAEHRATK
ncbi:MAG: LAGLIDADG family homing endonuclease [Candidatus Andersenbacteria bacterium]